MKPHITFLAGAGILLVLVSIVVGLKTYGPGTGGILDTILDGKEVSCNAGVDAELLGVPLRFTGLQCSSGEACVTNPLNTLFIGDRNGGLLLQYGGVTYDDATVELSAFSTTGKTYPLKACLPKDATHVTIALTNDLGGVLDAEQVTIQ